MNNSITDWVIDFVEVHYPANDDFDAAYARNLIWSQMRLDAAWNTEVFFDAVMKSVDWDAVEESFYPESVDVSWTATIEHTGTTSITFIDRNDYMRYKRNPEGYLGEYINYEFANESCDTDVYDIQVSED